MTTEQIAQRHRVLREMLKTEKNPVRRKRIKETLLGLVEIGLDVAA